MSAKVFLLTCLILTFIMLIAGAIRNFIILRLRFEEFRKLPGENTLLWSEVQERITRGEGCLIISAGGRGRTLCWFPEPTIETDQWLEVACNGAYLTMPPPIFLFRPILRRYYPDVPIYFLPLVSGFSH